MGENIAGSGAGRFSVIPDEHTVGENFFDSYREFLRPGESGAIENGCGIEQNQIGVSAFAKNTAIVPVQALRRE